LLNAINEPVFYCRFPFVLLIDNWRSSGDLACPRDFEEDTV
jgi:hypothetical protein